MGIYETFGEIATRAGKLYAAELYSASKDFSPRGAPIICPLAPLAYLAAIPALPRTRRTTALPKFPIFPPFFEMRVEALSLSFRRGTSRSEKACPEFVGWVDRRGEVSGSGICKPFPVSNGA